MQKKNFLKEILAFNFLTFSKYVICSKKKILLCKIKFKKKVGMRTENINANYAQHPTSAILALHGYGAISLRKCIRVYFCEIASKTLHKTCDETIKVYYELAAG